MYNVNGYDILTHFVLLVIEMLKCPLDKYVSKLLLLFICLFGCCLFLLSLTFYILSGLIINRCFRLCSNNLQNNFLGLLPTMFTNFLQ